MTIRVVHWGTGDTGKAALRSIIGNSQLELVGVYVARPERAGKDVGELLGSDPVGVVTTNDLDAFRAIDSDVLSFFGSGFDGSAVIPFLESGRDVVSTSLAPLILPEWAPAAIREPIERACAAGKTSIFVTGAEPGVGSDLLPMTILGFVDGVDCVRMQEIANYGRYPVEGIMKAWGFGNKPDEPVPLFEGGGPLGLWSSVVHHMAQHLGVELDDVQLVTDTAITDHDIDTACGTIEAGTVGAIRFEVVGMYRGRPLAVLEHVNFVDVDVAVSAGWPVGAAGQDTVYRIVIEGRPRIVCELDLDYDHERDEDRGLVVTATRAINGIPAVVAAPPGILGPMQVPPLFSGHILR